MLPFVSLGPICSTCVLSQIHLHFACAQFIPNRSSRLTTFPRILNCRSHKTTQNVAPVYRGRIVFSLCPFPDESIDLYEIWCQSVQPFNSFPRLLNLWPPNPPPPCPHGVLRDDLYLYSQMNPPTWTKVGANRSSRLTASRDFWMFDPLKPAKCPLVSLGAICLAYIHSQMNLHMCAKFCANRISRLTSSPDFWICDPLTPPPSMREGRIVLSLCPFPDESADVYQMWCQSVQLFDSLPDF